VNKTGEVYYVVGDKSPHKMKARVDAVFFRQLRHLLSVVTPGPFSREVGFLLSVAQCIFGMYVAVEVKLCLVYKVIWQ
jgi:hypothetical protein